jgi:TRAP-type C4-dicarboxylate transport system substrate-binding protein
MAADMAASMAFASAADKKKVFQAEVRVPKSSGDVCPPQWIKPWAKAIKTRTNGQVKIDLCPSSIF